MPSSKRSIRCRTAWGTQPDVECKGTADAFQCDAPDLIGAKLGTVMTLSIETVGPGGKRTEVSQCPIGQTTSVQCREIEGKPFQGSEIREHFTLGSGEAWQSYLDYIVSVCPARSGRVTGLLADTPDPTLVLQGAI